MFVSLLTCLVWLSPQEPTAAVTIEVTGVAVDAARQPVAGVIVTDVADLETIGAALAAAPKTSTDADGRFRVALTVPKGSTRHLLVGGGRWATRTCALATDKDLQLDLGAFAMDRGTSTAGRVRDEAGAPLAGATVVADDLLDRQPFLGDRDRNDRLVCRTGARSDARGIFRLPGMVQSAGSVRVSCPGYYDEFVQPAGIGTPLDVTLVAAPKWQGRVVDEAGNGVAEALIRFDYENAGQTAGDGTFAFAPRTRGVGTLRASKRVDGVYLSASVTLDPTQAPLLLRLEAPKETQVGTLRVRAKDPTGAAVHGFKAYVRWMPGNQLEYRCDAMLLSNSASRDEGWSGSADGEEARLVGKVQSSRDDTGLVFVIADGHGLGRLQIDTKALQGDPVVVTLPKEAVIRGRVLSATSGEPIVGAEVIPTQRITANERRHYSIGFRTVASLTGAPTSVRTDAQGRYELRGLPPGTCDLFVHVPGRIELPPQTLELGEGETKTDVDVKVPENVVLRGRLQGAVPVGAQVRVHWHRPNMSSSAWAGEYDGAVPITADGTFTLPDLHPKDYEVQLLVAATPRGGGRMKLPAGIWNGAAAAAEVCELACPTLMPITGKVAGTVPWQRLAVTVVWQEHENSYFGNFRLTGPISLLGPDRTFALYSPGRRVHLMLFDVATGVPLHWQEIDATNPVAPQSLDGDAVHVELTITAADAASARRECAIEIAPEDEHWPYGVGNFVPAQFGRNFNSGCRSNWRAGDRVDLWLRARSGQLSVKRDNVVLQALDLAGSTGTLQVQLPSAAQAK